MDLWTQILDLVDQLGDTIKWLHVPSHIGIKGIGRADALLPTTLGADLHTLPPPPPADEEPKLLDEESILGRGRGANLTARGGSGAGRGN